MKAKNQYQKFISTIIKSWLFSLLVVIFIVTCVRSSLADWYDIPSGSMQPTILVGDRVLVNKLAYDFKLPYTTFHLVRWASPKRGQIVVFYSPENGKRLIKRIIGIPGDTLAMTDNRLKINGQFVEYSPLHQHSIDKIEKEIQYNHLFLSEKLKEKQHSIMVSLSYSPQQSFYSIKVPEGKYFMMGDNRDNSADSRGFGFIDRKMIIGQATTVVISRKGSFLRPRWSRFFRKLI